MRHIVALNNKSFDIPTKYNDFKKLLSEFETVTLKKMGMLLTVIKIQLQYPIAYQSILSG